MDLDSKTKIPFFAAIGFIPTLVGGVLWLSNIDAKASSAEIKLEKLEQAIIDIAEIKKDIEYIKDSVKKGHK